MIRIRSPKEVCQSTKILPKENKLNLYSVLFTCVADKTLSHSVADQEFPRGGAANPQGALTYDFAKFSQKLHEIERIWTRKGGVQNFTM